MTFATATEFEHLQVDAPSRQGFPISKSYDADELVKWIQQTGALVVIPPRSNRTILRDYDNALYKEFNLLERMCGYLKHFHLVTTRYTKTTLLPVVHPARGFSYFWIKSLSTESSKGREAQPYTVKVEAG
jgi:hypothetical protein